MGRRSAGRVRRGRAPGARGTAPTGSRSAGLLRETESWRGVEHVVQPSGGRSDRVYRCPGCDHEVDARTSHLVVWPADGPDAVAERRHWHTRCWRARPGAH